MSGLLSSNAVIIFQHILCNIFVTYSSLFIAYAFPVKSFVKTKIGHNRSHNLIAIQLSFFFQVFTAYIHDLITIDHISSVIHSDTAVCIPIISKSDIQPFVYHKFL